MRTLPCDAGATFACALTAGMESMALHAKRMGRR